MTTSIFRNSQFAIRNPLPILLLLCLLAPSIAGAENRILKLTPDAGPVIGGTVVRISLEELAILGDLEVRFGNHLAAKVRRLGKSTLEVMTPPGNPGPVEVRVVNDFWGTATSPAVFTYLAVGTPRPVAATPEVIRVEPATLPVGSGMSAFNWRARTSPRPARCWCETRLSPARWWGRDASRPRCPPRS